MICVKDASMNVVHLGPEWQGITGLDVGECLGQGWLAAIHAEDRPMALLTLRRAARERRGYRMDYRLLHRSGSHVWVSDAAEACFVPRRRSFLGVRGSITAISTADHAARARGQAEPTPLLPPLPPTVTASTGPLLVEYLARARALAEGDPGLAESLDLALCLARRRFGRRPH